jgi:hypothetical protein
MPAEAQAPLHFKAGDIVYTLYGAGVIVSTEPTTNSEESLFVVDDNHDRTQETTPPNSNYWYTVRLWRIPNHSVGSSALAKLRSSVVCLSGSY